MKTINLAIILFVLLASCGQSQSKNEPFKPSTAEQQAMQKIATDAAVWGSPLVSTYAMRQAFFRDAGAKYGDIIYWPEPSDWKNQMLTPNPLLKCVYFNFNCKDGPVVLDIPPAKNGAWIFGSLLNAWHVPAAMLGPYGLDSGKGGKYLLLPPDADINAFPSGYFKVQNSTYNGYGMLWFIPEGNTKAALDSSLGALKDIKLYPLSQAASPPAGRYINMSGRLFDGIVRFDASFFEGLSIMINEEPAAPKDSEMLDQLKQLGIKKGSPFKPDSLMHRSLAEAAKTAYNGIRERLQAEGILFYLDRHWRIPGGAGSQTHFSYEIGDTIDKAARSASSFFGNAPRYRRSGEVSYLVAFVDSNGEVLKGEYYYSLHVPPNVPVEQFWAVAVYDAKTSAFIRESPVVSLDSYDERMRRNRDGSVDIYFGAKPPAGQKFNWIATKPGSQWFAMFRLRGPTKPLYYKTWKLPDIAKFVYGDRQKG